MHAGGIRALEHRIASMASAVASRSLTPPLPITWLHKSKQGAVRELAGVVGIAAAVRNGNQVHPACQRSFPG